MAQRGFVTETHSLDYTDEHQ